MLHPDLAFHELAVPLVRAHADYIGVAPETAWRHDTRGTLVANDYARLFGEVAGALSLPVVAHGLAASPSTEGEQDRLRAWTVRASEDRPQYAWWTDHHGVTSAGENFALPMPPLPTPRAIERTAERLDIVRSGLQLPVGLETTAFYAHWGDPMMDASLQTATARRAESHILLDLHNVWTMARNGGFSATDWLAYLDLDRVIEIHISGGSPAPATWGTEVWLDGHDGSVPEQVWDLLDAVLPYCRNVRGVLLERMEGSMGPREAEVVARELVRLRAACRDVARHAPPAIRDCAPLPAISEEQATRWQRSLGPSLRASRPREALATASLTLPAQIRDAIGRANPVGLAVSARLVAKLRPERVINGSERYAARCESDPQRFAGQFFRYHREVPAHGIFPWQEAAQFEHWMRRQ